MAAKAVTLLCCLASSEAITLWSGYTPSHSLNQGFIKTPISAYGANNVPTVFEGHPFRTDMNYETRYFKSAPILFNYFASPSSVSSFKGNQLYEMNSKPSKALNSPSQSSHYLINEGLSAYKTEAMDAGHSTASYVYSTDSDVPFGHGSFSDLSASYSW